VLPASNAKGLAAVAGAHASGVATLEQLFEVLALA
jgi:hypothetical protein